MSFINGYMVEINQFPRFGDKYTIKEFFYYDSNTKEYGYRDTVIPKEEIINSAEMTEDVIARIINNKEPVMKRVFDLNNFKESWIFEPTV